MTSTLKTAASKGTRIVATGCTSGLGIATIRHILQTTPKALPPPYHVILLGRGVSLSSSSTSSPALKAHDELSAIAAAIEGGDVKSSVDLVACDLCSLSSVDQAAKEILQNVKGGVCDEAAASAETRAWREISPGRIDVLLLNAAAAKATRTLIKTAPALTSAEEVDANANANEPEAEALQDEHGQYEQTALVNHIAQQYLTAQLLPHMISTSHDQPTPRVVFTGSLLHRKLKEINHLDAFFNPRSATAHSAAQTVPWTLIHSYGASKFLQVLGVQHLVGLLRDKFGSSQDTKAKVDIVIVEPGFIPGTGLNRDSSLPVRLLMSYVFPYLPLPFVETLQQGAENIAAAMSRPLDGFQWSQNDTFGDTSSTTWDGHTVRNGVRTLMLAKRGAKVIPDHRTDDEQLAQKWWPRVVQKQWERV